MKNFNKDILFNDLPLLPAKLELETKKVLLKTFSASGLRTPKTVGIYLRLLEEKGYLKSTMVGKEKLYLNYKLMEILENN